MYVAIVIFSSNKNARKMAFQSNEKEIKSQNLQAHRVSCIGISILQGNL
ncbi:MAG: hypothetical protein JETT_2493 [Candidatus Jettenia ecosi]|uniref:Uncharacterized protein n=1 Tax=Candidatus Jettenia ecosi TaxID=2494326 RepID=A0A533Q998_9BACT|nr:MAG: hypothetical protein JETT_2493 [Candidatus Jettenia ecosi]